MEPNTSKSVEHLSDTLNSAEPKFFLLSKTVWGMIILAILVIAKWAGFNIDDTAGNAADVFEKIGAILVVLGLRTKSQPLTFKTEVSSGAVNLFVVCAMCVGMAAVLGLSSCSTLRGSMGNSQWSIGYKDEASGAKAGVTVSDGQWRPWAKVPFIDEDGNVVGEFEVIAPESAK